MLVLSDRKYRSFWKKLSLPIFGTTIWIYFCWQSNTRTYNLISGPHITHFSPVVSSKCLFWNQRIFFRPEGHVIIRKFWRRYEIRENNHAHSTATSVHSIKLKVSTKHFWRKTTIARQKATFWFKLSMKIKFWHTWRMIRLTPGALGEHLAHQPAFTHSQVFALSI